MRGGLNFVLKKFTDPMSLLTSQVPLALCVTGFSADPSVIGGQASKSDLVRLLKSKKNELIIVDDEQEVHGSATFIGLCKILLFLALGLKVGKCLKT